MPILGVFDRRCKTCKNRVSGVHYEINPFGAHVCSGCPQSRNRILRHDALAQLMKDCLIGAGLLAKTEHFSF